MCLFLFPCFAGYFPSRVENTPTEIFVFSVFRRRTAEQSEQNLTKCLYAAPLASDALACGCASAVSRAGWAAPCCRKWPEPQEPGIPPLLGSQQSPALPVALLCGARCLLLSLKSLVYVLAIVCDARSHSCIAVGELRS